VVPACPAWLARAHKKKIPFFLFVICFKIPSIEKVLRVCHPIFAWQSV
jgi:hypothetical protein